MKEWRKNNESKKSGSSIHDSSNDNGEQAAEATTVQVQQMQAAIAQRAKVMPVRAQMQQEQRVPEALIHQIWQEHRSPC